jgi:hypothetical protein
MGFLISIIPVMTMLYALYNMIRLFDLYEQCIIFTINNTRCFKRIAVTLILWDLLLQPIFDLLMSVAMTWPNPISKRMAIASNPCYAAKRIIALR